MKTFLTLGEPLVFLVVGIVLGSTPEAPFSAFVGHMIWGAFGLTRSVYEFSNEVPA